jgi:hypothetical protein
MSNVEGTVGERHFLNTVISALATLGGSPTREQVEEKAMRLAEILVFEGNLDGIVKKVLIAMDTRMGEGVSLVDVEAVHDDRWVKKRADISWTHADAYAEYLRWKGWPPHLVRSLGDVTDRILGLLQDPKSLGTVWSRRGLVIGHVQSGKTANYTGLIARAADAGYRFIIVIAGIHNNLRSQTQRRLDEAFIGRSSDPRKSDKSKIGVGNLTPNYPHPVTLTNIHDDFSRATARRSGWRINDFTKPIILVIKKNVSTLEALLEWLRGLNAQGDDRIRDVPMLVIDDEADNASINTNQKNLDPTRTNARIRNILSLFAKSCYVGYTATPFANIFIDPDAYDERVREELFPRDFIYCLDAPTSYLGPDRVFGDEESDGKDLHAGYVRPIMDCEDLIPLDHGKDHEITGLPPSLHEALDELIVARAIRNLRGQQGEHCSMLVNVSRFVSVQRQVCDHMSLRVQHVREAVRANHAMPEEVSSRNEYMQGLRGAFEREYAGAKCSWEQVRGALDGVFENLQLHVINSRSGEVLDYERHEREGLGLTAIAIGGLSLSRGLTIEGLTVSYMYRNTKMYDTLMQMGRWFGYRPDYEDLCRIHLSIDSINWYAHIARAAEELVLQVQQMRRDRLSPTKFGLYVRSHPDGLLVTARNKMRNSRSVNLELSLSGRLLESYIVSIDPEVNERNLGLLAAFWSGGFGGRPEERTLKGIIFRRVPVSVMVEFLDRFQCPPDFEGQKSGASAYLRKIEEKYLDGDVLLISPGGIAEDGGAPRLKNQVRAIGEGQPMGTSWRLNKDRVASRGDEKLGLSEEQMEQARRLASPDGGKGKPSDIHYRMVRNRPLLMLHSLEPRSVNPGSDTLRGPVAAFGVSFPCGDYGTTISVQVNSTWIRQNLGAQDDPEDEDDYDA